MLVLDNGRRMALEPFEREMLVPYFDRCRETTVCVAKGQGKTTLLAALELFELV